MQTTVSYTNTCKPAKSWLFMGVGLLLCSYFSAAQTLRVAVPDYPPYTYVHNDKIVGEGFDAFISIMNQLQVEYHAEPVPHFGRSLMDMENNQLDALLLATESPERSALAEYSVPLFLTDWAWVWLAKRQDIKPDAKQFKQTAIVSAQMNSNIYRWLALQDYKITPGTSDIRGLFNLLNHGRVDAIMLPAVTATAVIKQHQLDQRQYKIHKQRQLPYGIYISKAYLAANPGFMASLNQAIANYHASTKPTAENKTQTKQPKN